MNTENFNDPHISEIRGEYKKIDKDWLLMHYKISVGLAILAFIVECFMGFILIDSDMLTTTVDKYIWKFILVPGGINLLCILADTMVMRSKRLPQNQKIYLVSLIFVVVCFTLCAVHNAFIAVYCLFAIAIVLTTIYASYSVTCVTALASIAALNVAEFLVKWDVDKISIFESTLRFGNFLVVFFILLGCAMVCLLEIRYERKKNEASIQKELERHSLKQRLRMDEMTGLFNQKSLHDAMRDIEVGEVAKDCIFAIADIDHFKGINDRFGHHIGDLCLVGFAQILKECCTRAEVFRYGGDEFCLLFRNTSMANAVLACEQVQEELKGLCLEGYPGPKLTVSFGLAPYSGQVNVARLFINADQALYEAKQKRNSVCIFQPQP